MRAGRILVVVAVAALGLGLCAGVALAGKKKKNTTVIYFSGNPRFNNGGKVQVKGSLNTVKACRISRGVRLQLLDPNGAVTTLDGSTTDSNGNWFVQAQLPKGLPANTDTVRVKALKASAGKFVCKAGVSTPVPVPATK